MIKNPDKKSIKSVVNKSFDPIYNKTKDISNYLSSISVIHITHPNNLPNITSEGLKIEKSVTPMGANEIIEMSKRIKKELNKPEDRYKAIYAVFKNRDTLHFINYCIESNKYSVIEFKIDINDPDIYIADVDFMNDAITHQIYYNKQKDDNLLHRMENSLYEYWKSFIPISEYINSEYYYYNTEILIFHDIEPSDLNILIK